MKGTNHKAPDYAVFSGVQLLPTP